ncbi:MAG: helix-turn-helix transcriptional regulator [Eubacteriales bacterium]
MLNERIKTLRKERRMTQEELAIKLNVVRQTVSKWEKGQSVPDAGLLIQLAEVFEVNVSELLGGSKDQSTEVMDNNEIAQQLERINEHLAVRNKGSNRIWKIILGIVIAIVVFHILMVFVGMVSYQILLEPDVTITPNYEEKLFID